MNSDGLDPNCPAGNADDTLCIAMANQRSLYPPNMSNLSRSSTKGCRGSLRLTRLIPQALHHAFATFGALMSPDLPLKRRQHEMIATMVSLTNKCHY